MRHHLKAATAIALGLGLFAGEPCAEERPGEFDAALRNKSVLDWDNPKWWQRDWRRDELKFSVGQKDFSVTGPLATTFRSAPRSASDLNLGQKILSLPIINLFVPQPMPVPPRDESRYFAWGDKSLPWSAVAERGNTGPVGLLSVNW